MGKGPLPAFGHAPGVGLFVFFENGLFTVIVPFDCSTILVGPVLAAEGFRDSHLYSKARARG